MKKTKKHYLKIVEWSEEDGCYVGTCPGLMFGGVHGDDEATVYKELCELVVEVVALKQQHRDPLPKSVSTREYSGKFVLRCDPDLHKLLSVRALQEGESLNNYVVKQLKAVA